MVNEVAQLPAQAYVYVIGAADGPQKIGIASDAESRRAMLQTGNPTALAVAYRLPLSRADAFTVEARAHWHLGDKRIRGEWFDATPGEAIAAVEAAHRDFLSGLLAPSEPDPRGAYWQQRLRAAGLSQADLARLAGKRENAISAGLRGLGKSGVPIYLRTLIRMWELADPVARLTILENPDAGPDASP